MELRLLTPTHETTYTFHVMGDSFDFHYDGILILGQDFWKDKKATINYCNRTIIMGEIVLNFDKETNSVIGGIHKITLKGRTENIVQLPTTSKGHGIIPKSEVAQGVFLAESLTNVVNGYCITSIVNTLEEDITIDLPQVELEEVEIDPDDTV
jgi:hypothetical protein